MKFPYDLPFLPGAAPPMRWDVVVFRYPEKPEESYIKRLVGLSGETLRIWYGDIFIRPPGGANFRQERRPIEHQQSMQMMVYDDAHRAAALNDRPEWRRWRSEGSGQWGEDGSNPGTFRGEAAGSEWAEMRYHHLVPDPLQWRSIEAGETSSRPPRPTLITDFYSYNTNLPLDISDLTGPVYGNQEYAWLQPHWVGDLTLSARVETQGKGSVRFELIEGGESNTCTIDLSTGEAVLQHGEEVLGKAETRLKGVGIHDLVFANVDNRLTLLVDGKPVPHQGFSYADPSDRHPEPTDEDLHPARVAVRGGAVTVSGLVLKRDIYYTISPGRTDYDASWGNRMPRNPMELADLLGEPSRVAALGPLNWVDYPVGSDRFLMLGDNSPRSKDSRGWGDEDRYDPDTKTGWDTSRRERWEVPRPLVTGKAFCVYWPHGKPFGPSISLGPDFRIPFRPYFERMKFIH
jgi:signal peptidase I